MSKEETNAGHNVYNAPAPQQVDLNAFAEVAREVKGTIPATEKGFVPLTDFQLTRPYEDWSEFLAEKNRLLEEERQRLRADDPETKLEAENDKLRAKKAEFEKRHEVDLDKRFDDLERYHREQLADRQTFHKEELRLRDDSRDNLTARIAALEAARNSLEARIISDHDRYIDEIKSGYEERIELMRSHHEELKQTLEDQNAVVWKQTKQAIDHIQETIQARKSGIKVSRFLDHNFGLLNFRNRLVWIFASFPLVVAGVIAVVTVVYSPALSPWYTIAMVAGGIIFSLPWWLLLSASNTKIEADHD